MCDFRLALALPLPVSIGKLSRETAITFARSYVRRVETAITFARSYVRRVETIIAFAGEEWAFLVQFLGAEVMVVSRWPISVVVVVLLVSKSARGCA